MSWIGLTYPDKHLMGYTTQEMAECISMCTWLSNTVHTAFSRWVRPDRFANGEDARADVRQSAKAHFWQSLREIDCRIGERHWLMGDHFTACDTYALVFYTWAPELELPIAELKNYAKLKDLVLARPLARKVLERENNRLLTM